MPAPTPIEAATLERGTENPQRDALAVCELYDELSRELFYGFNFKMELMELDAATFETIKAFVAKARVARVGAG